jgi:hypothetical protein
VALWNVKGQIVDDSQEGVRIPEYGSLTLPNGQLLEWGDKGVQKLPEYRNPYQYGADPYQWDPTSYGAGQGPHGGANVGYIPRLFEFADRIAAGTAKPYEREEYAQARAVALGIPARDLAGLTPYQSAGQDANPALVLSPQSPDLGNIMLTLRDKVHAGQAAPQEHALFDQMMAQLAEQNYRANVPQESDANPFGLGDNLFGALFTIGLGASGGLAAAPLAAGGAGLGTTLGSIGTLAGTAGSLGNLVAPAFDEPWMADLTRTLGAVGGLTGGVGGLVNLSNTGLQSFGDAARLAQSAGRITGALGTASGVPGAQQAGQYLGLAGQLGRGASGAWDLFGAVPEGGQGPALSSVLGGLGGLGRLGTMLMGRGSGGPPAPATIPRSGPSMGPRGPGVAGVSREAVPAPTAPFAGAGGVSHLMQLAQEAQARSAAPSAGPPRASVAQHGTVPLLMQLARAAQARGPGR